MAANPSTSPMQKHDVFLSFRGEDTRDTFTSHLYAALRRKRVGAYIDYRLAKGDEVSPALAEAIRESKISVIVFSENYASSTWCLDELVHILSCKDENGQLVVPVFYGVDPSHVRKQQGSYAAALAALEERLAAAGIEKLRRWRRALTIAASLSGWDSSVTKPEAELVEEIVKDIVKKLKSFAVRGVEYKGLVGINKRVEKIESLLRFGTPDVRCICIWGMAGIGKTTLARIVFDRLSSEFEGCCFVENIGERLKMLGREGLKNEVICTLLDEKASNTTVTGGFTFYASRLRHTKVLVVLDDLKNSQELRHLVGDDDWFAPESRIIVTTRDKQLLRNQIDNDCIYEVEGLDYDEALQLFNLNAFKRNSPTTNCIEISKSVINYCKGNPLALNVLGSFFCGKREEKWKDALDKLKKLPSDEIQNVLKISYDGLDRMQKDIFLDIACFFEGNDRDHVERILDACDFSANIGIDDLVDKSLVTVVNNKLRMHCLLQEMGREIIRQQSISDPGERSRIWLAKDAYNVLSDNRGTPKIEGIFMDMSEINRDLYLSPTTFQRMLNLRLLKLYNHAKNKRKVYLPENLHHLPNMLRYLHWDGYPTKALPANFSAEYLVELIMPNSQVEELWSGVQNLTSLRKIDLSYSKNLREIPNLCEAINLEHLYLEYCGSLSQVPSDFKHLDKLKNLILEGCSSLKVFPELPNSIEYLVLSGTEIEEVPSSIRNLTQLQILSMRDCKRLVSLPTCICELKLLLSLSLSGCAKLERFPEIYEPMWSLMVLELDNTSIETLPLTIRNLQGIRYFVLEDHKLIPHNVCKFRSSTCLSLMQLKILTAQDLKLPYQFFYEQYCPEIQIASISRSALAEGLDDPRALCGKEFLFYNYVRLPNYINQIDDSSTLKFFHTEIQRRYSNSKRGFLDTDYGVCYSLDTEIPNWFLYRFEDSSSIRIRLDKHGIDTLLGFSVCVAVGFGDNYFDVHRRFRLVCQAHYRLRDGRLLSWDFYWNEFGRETDVLKKNFRSKYLSRSAEGKVRFEFIHDMITPEVVFDFYFVDENNEPIQGCNLKKCGIHLLFEKDFRERFAFFGERGLGDAFTPSGSRVVDFYIEEEEEDDDDDDDDGEGGGRDKKLRDNDIVVSISRPELAQHFDQRVFLFYGFLQLHGRDGMDYLKVKVFDQEMLSQSRFKGVLQSSNEDVGAYCQGSEIPNSFEYKCDKPQMWVELPLDSLVDSNFLGFVLCAVVEFKDLNYFNRFKLQYQYGISILHDSRCLTGVCGVQLRDTRGLALNYFGGNDDYRAFSYYLGNKHRQEKLGDEQYCISYVWTFKIRCVDENCKPLGDNQCKIRTCSIKHLFVDELGSTSSASSTSANRPREEVNGLSKTSPNNQDVDKFTMKEKLFNMVRNFIM